MGIDRVHLVPLGVDAATFSPSRRDPGWRREVGVRNGQPVALYVGRLATEKRLDVVLEALPQLHQETGLKLVLIGEGHLRAGLERRAAAHPDQLRVLPFERDRERLARAYASADLYLAPFPHETFGLAVVEAMASGLPVVGVASGALEELLGGAPWARLYPPGQTAQLRAGIIELLGIGPRAGPLARIAATRQFSWEETFRRLERVYRNAVSHVA
jgi:glycosyltransferase involved in cell wall biosynthesis